MPLSLHTKQKLFILCNDFVENSIAILQQAMDDSQLAANADEKGSAGDKHETGRAMMHLEKEKNAKQLAERLKLREVISLLKPEEKHSSAQLGSLIMTKNANYYLSIPMGKVEIDGIDYLVISTVSPIGQLLLSKKKGDTFIFNGKESKVVDLL